MDNELINAIYSGNISEIKRLLSEGVDINVYNERALRIACALGEFDIIKLLVEHGAEITEQVIERSIRHGKIEVTNYLNNQLLLEKINDFS
jgi:ankyrin repeat protein